MNSSNSNKNLNTNFKDMKLNINSGIITLINETIVSSLCDFNGLLLAKYKQRQQTQSIDSNANYVSNTLHLIIDDVILIFDKQYINKRLDNLIQTVQSKYPDSVVIGLCSGKSYSFPKMSLNEQELYFKLFQVLRNDTNPNSNPYLSLPLLFGAFAHNISNKDTDQPSIKNINFQSKFFYYDLQKSIFSSVSYAIVNIKDTTYLNVIEPISNKLDSIKLSKGSNSNKTENDKRQKNQLKEILNNQLEEIESKQLKQIKELKSLLKNELEEYLTLNKQLQALNQ